ncbi:galactosyl transferase [Gordonia phage Syleon]|uniref:Galactosyltransferase n=1 Tax=Gordonia phage Syleon TaxID=2653718 RepID=A0A5Q2WGQ6_9CAUD|nr:galactosyl transferase [Gordonia phage Syleon]QGH75849.1 galactosyltransferase [Gordonia phage Syleon]
MAEVCIPWRATPERKPAFARVTDFWLHHDFELLTGDSDRRSKSFSITQARNKAVNASKGDVVILADADTIVDIAAVREAISTVKPGEVIYPFATYRHIPGDAVSDSDLHAAPVEQEYRNSVGGIMVTLKDTYWELGGMDERFEPRWGYEDSAFKLAAETLGTVRRLPGTIYSFNHPADRDLSYGNPNRHRFDLYRACAGKPNLMRELVKR